MPCLGQQRPNAPGEVQGEPSPLKCGREGSFDEKFKAWSSWAAGAGDLANLKSAFRKKHSFIWRTGEPSMSAAKGNLRMPAGRRAELSGDG